MSLLDISLFNAKRVQTCSRIALLSSSFGFSQTLFCHFSVFLICLTVVFFLCSLLRKYRVSWFISVTICSVRSRNLTTISTCVFEFSSFSIPAKSLILQRLEYVFQLPNIGRWLPKAKTFRLYTAVPTGLQSHTVYTWDMLNSSASYNIQISSTHLHTKSSFPNPKQRRNSNYQCLNSSYG